MIFFTTETIYGFAPKTIAYMCTEQWGMLIISYLPIMQLGQEPGVTVAFCRLEIIRELKFLNRR